MNFNLNKHLAQLPEGWSFDRLKDIAALNASSLPASTDPNYEFDYLEITNVDYYGVTDPHAMERIRFEDAPSRARRRVAKNATIVSSVRPNLQAAAFFPDGQEDLVCSTGFNVVQPFEAKLSPRFTYYFLISEHARQYFEAAAKGVGYPAVDDKDFGTILVPIPSRREQEQIATYLDRSCAAIDSAMFAKRRQIESLRAVRQSLIEIAVIFGICPSPNLRRVGEDWIDKVPTHWDVCRIKRVLSRVDYGISESTDREGRFPVLKMGHIQDGEVDFTDLEFVDDVSNDLVLEHGDLLYNRTNSPDQVAKAAVFRGNKKDNMTFASYLVRLRANHRADPFFLNYLLNSTGFLQFARKMAIPSVQQSNLNSTRYGRILIPLPPVPEQREIAGFLDQKTAELKAATFEIERQIETLVAYRKSLIHECVTGQRRVTETELRQIPVYA